MKKILGILLFAGLLGSCYEDKGNYDYTLDSMNEITSVEFTPAIIMTLTGKVIEVRQALSEEDATCRIEAKLEQTLEKNLDNLDFRWYRTYEKNGVTIKDTIFTKGFLELTLPIGEHMEQDILLQIYDNTTTLSHYSSFKFRTRPIFQNSLFVLHGEENDRKLGNIEIIGKDTMIYTDIKTVTKDNNPYRYADGFDYAAYENKLSFTIFSKNDVTRVYEPFGMKLKFTSKEMFKPNVPDFTFKSITRIGDPGATAYSVALTEDGKFYTGNYLPALYKPGYSYEVEGNAEHETDYYITAATLTEDCYFLWDDKGKRLLFCATENIAHTEEESRNASLMSNSIVADTEVDLTGIPVEERSAVLGYINHQQGWDNEYKDFYFIMKDGAGNYYRQEFKTGTKTSTEECTMVGEKLLANLNAIDPSTIRYNSCFSTNYLFYANGNTVFRYNISNGDNVEVYRVPEGYDITMLKFRTNYYSPANQVGDLNRIMSIGLYNEAEGCGAIAEIRLTTAADFDDDFTPLFYDKDDKGEKWGRIKDIQFAHKYDYDLADYQKNN